MWRRKENENKEKEEREKTEKGKGKREMGSEGKGKGLEGKGDEAQEGGWRSYDQQQEKGGLEGKGKKGYHQKEEWRSEGPFQEEKEFRGKSIEERKEGSDIDEESEERMVGEGWKRTMVPRWKVLEDRVRYLEAHGAAGKSEVRAPKGYLNRLENDSKSTQYDLSVLARDVKAQGAQLWEYYSMIQGRISKIKGELGRK